MRILLYLVFVVAKLQFARCQGQMFGGGSSGFGYDASSACSKPFSRAARARFENLPCDFKRQNWCTVAGSAYPWHAVRRFVQENQGLMRRMYGEERHISVLRAELDNNDVDELETDDNFFHTSDNSRNFQYQEDYGFEDDAQDGTEEDEEEYEGRGFTSKSLDDTSPRKRYSKFPKLGEYTKPHFRPAGTTATTTTTTGRPITKLTLTESSEGDIKTVIKEKQNTINVHGPTTPVTTLAQIANIQNLSINEIPGQLDRLDTIVENFTDFPDVPEAMTEETTLETGGTTDIPTTVIVDRIGVMVNDEPARNNPKEELAGDQMFAASEQQFRPRPEFRPPEVKPDASSMEGQLYQDVAGKDPQQPVLKLRGVNACPVKEEVVAPFWANNTRGEVLALLNLYPFEQYVHWEKCTNENKQMYCRDGCRCEQQYRLHRLLAYDPNNECRGIFSDWFKFPSCCVCRCYDLPLEFRVTSRSPRTQKPHRKTHNHISSEWYRHGG